MKAVLIGAGALGVMTAKLLLRHGHEVVLIDIDKTRLDALAEEIDCGFLLGDGSKPALLKESGPEDTDHLFCLTDSDQTNIIATLVGRSLSFAQIVTRIEDPEYEHICLELGLDNTIIPSRTIGRYLADMFEGRDPYEMSTMIRDEARVFSFVAREEDQVKVDELSLPSDVRVMCIYRAGSLIIPTGTETLKYDDEVVLITHSKNVDTLRTRWTAAKTGRSD